MHLVNWKIVRTPILHGGLKIKYLQVINRAIGVNIF